MSDMKEIERWQDYVKIRDKHIMKLEAEVKVCHERLEDLYANAIGQVGVRIDWDEVHSWFSEGKVKTTVPLAPTEGEA